MPMHNPKNSIRIISCGRCGASKALRWQHLDDEQKIIAERTASAEGLVKEQKVSSLFCARCLYPVAFSDPMA